MELILAGPVSWSRLIGERLAALVLGVLVITAGRPDRDRVHRAADGFAARGDPAALQPASAPAAGFAVTLTRAA